MVEMQFGQFISHVKPIYCCAYCTYSKATLHMFHIIAAWARICSLVQITKLQIAVLDYHVVDCRVLVD